MTFTDLVATADGELVGGRAAAGKCEQILFFRWHINHFFLIAVRISIRY